MRVNNISYIICLRAIYKCYNSLYKLPLVNYSWIYHIFKDESRLKATFPNFHLHSEAHNSISFCRAIEAERWLEIYRTTKGRNLEARYIRNETVRNIWRNLLLSFALPILVVFHFHKSINRSILNSATFLSLILVIKNINVYIRLLFVKKHVSFSLSLFLF